MTIITLLTDFGLTDGYVGVMKGVILSITPAARLIDLSHEIAPQNVGQAAFVLSRSVPYFPPDTVHLVVVDPGVGSERRAILVHTAAATFVGPDNGVLTPFITQPGVQIYRLNRPQYWLPEVSQTFHGRDLFAPVAAHLAGGVPPAQLGEPIADPVRLSGTAAERRGDGQIEGEVVYVDHFGNLITNIPGVWVAGGQWECRIGETSLRGLRASYAGVEEGALLALVSSGGTVEIAVRGGSAAARLAVGPGHPVALWPLVAP